MQQVVQLMCHQQNVITQVIVIIESKGFTKQWKIKNPFVLKGFGLSFWKGDVYLPRVSRPSESIASSRCPRFPRIGVFPESITQKPRASRFCREYRVFAMPSVSTNRCIFWKQDPKTEGIAFLRRVSRPRDALGFQEEVYLLKARPKNRGHRVSSESIASSRCPRFLVKLT